MFLKKRKCFRYDNFGLLFSESIKRFSTQNRVRLRRSRIDYLIQLAINI